jgi:hypothetical protein
MQGPFVLCLLLSLAFAGATNAAGPDESVQAPATATNDSELTTQAELTPDSFATPPQTVVMSPDSSCPCTDNESCCGNLVGKYRCLWDTYCADRRECWRKACGQGSCCRSQCGTSCGKTSRALIVVSGTRCSVRKGHLHRAGCHVSNCDGCCGGAIGADGVVEEAAPTKEGVPAEPTPADPGALPETAPNPPESEGSPQVIPPTVPETPTIHDTKSASSRRTWWLKRSNNIPR